MLAQVVLGNSPYEFNAIIKNIPHFGGKHELLQHAALQANTDGLWCEFGVYSGASLNVLTTLNSPVYGFDSFEGLPEQWNSDNPKGAFNTNGQPPFIVNEHMRLVIGWFKDTLPTFIETNSIKTPSLLHLDADLYSSTKCVLDEFKPHFKDSCVMVFDEFYNYDGWQNHEYKALYEFLNDMEDRIYNVELIGYAMDVYCPLAIKIKLKS